VSRQRILTAGLLLVAMTFVWGCGPQGRIKGEDEGSLVGAKTAGAATYNDLVSQSVEKLMAELSAVSPAEGKKLVCFVDVENRSAEELAENKEALYEQIDTIIINSGAYSSISRRYVEAALRKTGLRSEEIFLADGRSKFMSVLGESGLTPDYLMWGKVTSLSTGGSQVREREYLLTMELVNAKSGLTEAKTTSKVRKEYKK
jgi:hypothetical protein